MKLSGTEEIGKYGRMRREYLRKHRPILYNRLLLSEKLYAHLSEIDRTAQERTELMMNESDEAKRSDREDESGKSDALGADDEQLESPSGRGDPDRADIQLTTSGEQISLFDGMAFPTESEQIEYIDKAETDAFSAFSLSQDDIDTVLRYGGNADDGRMRITAEFMKDKPTEAHAEYLKSLFRGGNGYRVNGRDIAAWCAEDGIRIASGRQAENAGYAQVIPWTDAAKRIDELLEAGEFATETELAEAAGNERRLAAQELVYLQRDIREDVRDKYFDKSWFEGIFSESCDRITDMLSDNSMRDIVTDAASRFAEDYAKDKSLLLFHYHKPEETARKLRELSDMKRTFRGRTDRNAVCGRIHHGGRDKPYILRSRQWSLRRHGENIRILHRRAHDKGKTGLFEKRVRHRGTFSCVIRLFGKQ